MDKAVSSAAKLVSTVAPAVLTTLHANLSAANLHANLSAPAMNLSTGLHGAPPDGGGAVEHQMTEGGFLTGRNPFVFMPAVPLPTFIIQLVVIVCMSRLVKLILTPIKQPSVIAEIISGILLGPTAMGQIPYFSEFIFPKPSLPFLSLMSNFGLVLFLFLVGLELDPTMLRKSVKVSFAISMAGMALPFALGCGSSYVLFEYIETEEHRQKGFLSYLLFLGVAMAITAFPVLARILTELNLLKTKVGSITISAAAVDDATSWCLLALVVSLLNANSHLTALYVFLLGLAYTLFLIIVIRPIFIFGLRKAGVFEADQPSQASIFVALMIVFISGFITDAIGIHAIFGGFIAGIIMPHEKGFAYHITEKLEDVVQVLFLPLYFALSGLKTKVGTLADPLSFAVLCLVIFVACTGKIVGCTLAARGTKLTWRESIAVGTLMNCKGLVELIVLNLGYDSGVISDRTFAIMVIMALVTTFITVPVVNLTFPPEFHDEVKPETKKNKDPTLMVSVNRIEQVGPILSVVNLLQEKLNHDRSYKHVSRKGSNQSSTVSLGPDGPTTEGHMKGSSSFTSLADVINLIPSGKGSRKHSHHHGVNISVLRLIELTERDSSVMLHANQAALSNDPITRLIKTFCEVSNKHNNIEGLVKVVTMQSFGRVLAKTGEEVGAQYILIPWSGSGSIVEESSPPRKFSVSAGVARRRHSIHTPTQHSNFLMDLIQEAKSSVVMFVDRGGPVVTADMMKMSGEHDMKMMPEVSRKQIYLPFFGGRDDREALDIVMGLRHLGTVKINVIRYKSTEDLREAGAILEGDDMDEKYLQAYFGHRKGSTGSGASSGDGDVLEGVHYSEVETHSPVTTAMEKLARLSGSDLVICGRSNLKMGDKLGVNYGSEDGERRRVLGDLAEALMLCQCTASILVVHSVSKNNNLTQQAKEIA